MGELKLTKPSLCAFLIVIAATGLLLVAIQPAKATSKTIIVPDDYPTIQAAVTAANAGDTIFVRNGTHVENPIIINKPVSLIGENPENTTIKLSPTYTTFDFFGNSLTMVSSYGINVASNDVVISGFKIVPNLDQYWLYYGISATGNRTQLLNNIIEDRHGLYLGGFNQSVSQNNLTNTPVECNGSFNIISTNNVMGGGDGLRGSNGISLKGSHNTLLNNNIVNSPLDAYGFIGVYGSLNAVYSNKISGIISLRGNGAKIEKNNITEGGINLQEGSNNVIKLNRIQNGTGFSLGDYHSGYSNTFNNTFNTNTVENCSSGFTFSYLDAETQQATNNTAYHNNFINNTRQLVIETLSTGVQVYYFFFDNGKEGNYWSDFNGTDGDKDGIFDSSNVLYYTDEYREEKNETNNRLLYSVNILDRHPLVLPFDIDNDTLALPTPSPSPTPTLSPSPSIPEFPTWIILPALLIISAFVVAASRIKRVQSALKVAFIS